MAILAMLNTRTGKAGLGLVLLLLAFGWHKGRLGLKDLEISGLKKEKIELEGQVIEQANLKKICQVNLSGTRSAIKKQNKEIQDIKLEADLRVAAATDQALAAITPPDLVDKMITGPPGHNEMNIFIIDLLGRGSQ